ncbi:MAG TPA: hypothetical protein VLG49_05850 [Rhabdochlamydiaceae bacterium]|nr:hypothetical protein [Rhabdochlamydiaceae bacterium]
MKKTILMATTFMSVAAGISLQAGEETAWQRKTMETAKQEMAKSDESSFASRLSAYSYQQYLRLTPEQKKQAMDFADNNKMSPDDAVARVMQQ